MLVRYKPIDHHFAALPNKVLSGRMVTQGFIKGLTTLLDAHGYLFNQIEQIYDADGRQLADRADVDALYLLMRLVGELTAAAALEAPCLS